MTMPENTIPGAKLLFRDDVEAQYMISFGEHAFWLGIAARGNAAPRPVFVFSGHGGVGSTNNLNGGDIAAQFRRNMIADGFAFICAVCRPDAWGDPASSEETLAAAAFCRKHLFPVPDKLTLLGFSMGGLGVLMFAARHTEKTARVADIFGVTDLADFADEGKYPEELAQLGREELLRRSPCRFPEKYAGIPLLIIHGTRDSIVSITYSERFYEKLQKTGGDCRFLTVPDCGHQNEILAAAGDAVKSFLGA